MRDISGAYPPKKPIIRVTAEGFKAKIWYRNGSGMLWRWTFYFTDVFPSPEEAFKAAQDLVKKSVEDARVQKEMNAAMMLAMSQSLKELRFSK